MSRLAAVGSALGPYRYSQGEITAALADFVTPDAHSRALLERFHAAARVDTRHLALPLESYARLTGFTEANDAFLRVGVELGELAVREAMAAVGLRPDDVDLVLTTTVTGIAAPSLDARLVSRLQLRSDVKRLPVFGLGCVAGAAGVARLHEYLHGHPDDVAVLLAVELCSLTIQPADCSPANLVASGLFGDGAAAVVMVGERRAERLGLSAPQVRASRSRFYADTERVMGWDVGGTGFRIVLAASVADVVQEHLGLDVKTFLADEGLEVDDVAHWVTHPGGPKVLDAVRAALGLPPDALARSWQSLAQLGNLSSASVLHVLRDTLAAEPPGTGQPAVMLAMGPGFCSELVLLRW